MYNFPPVNDLTRVDRQYFTLVQKEAEWPNKVEDETAVEISEEEIGFESNGLTETDREYFNIVGTEDGLSKYFKSRTSYPNVKKTLPNFLYHLVALQRTNMSVVGVYIN